MHFARLPPSPLANLRSLRSGSAPPRWSSSASPAWWRSRPGAGDVDGPRQNAAVCGTCESRHRGEHGVEFELLQLDVGGNPRRRRFRGNCQSADSRKLASPILMTVNLVKRDGDEVRRFAAFRRKACRPSGNRAGRSFRPGVAELIVGKSAERLYKARRSVRSSSCAARRGPGRHLRQRRRSSRFRN